jgi:hypothetical protein
MKGNNSARLTALFGLWRSLLAVHGLLLSSCFLLGDLVYGLQAFCAGEERTGEESSNETLHLRWNADSGAGGFEPGSGCPAGCGSAAHAADGPSGRPTDADDATNPAAAG